MDILVGDNWLSIGLSIAIALCTVAIIGCILISIISPNSLWWAIVFLISICIFFVSKTFNSHENLMYFVLSSSGGGFIGIAIQKLKQKKNVVVHLLRFHT
ncbi:hypothetical protein [Photobacterium carnosum]|uniref:hypothetical protein n=1 Tax=Photobacterium carnosum TaxID=2023717 RepID=UPI001E2B1ED5|nr:hypothetical protein [Photobacterium carnosum]MCD9500378.1 hypothetical protein [Photobacterium carnosum]